MSYKSATRRIPCLLHSSFFWLALQQNNNIRGQQWKWKSMNRKLSANSIINLQGNCTDLFNWDTTIESLVYFTEKRGVAYGHENKQLIRVGCHFNSRWRFISPKCDPKQPSISILSCQNKPNFTFPVFSSWKICSWSSPIMSFLIYWWNKQQRAVLDMINNAYRDKNLSEIRAMFQEKLISINQAVNIKCWICLSLSRLFLTPY